MKKIATHDEISSAFSNLYELLQKSDRLEADECLGLVAQAQAVWLGESEEECDEPAKEDFFDNAFPYALGYWQGRATGFFENGTYENMTEYHKHLYKLGYDAGVADYCEMDMVNS